MSRYRQSFNEAYQQVEKWSKDVEVKSTGEHKDKTIGQLEKEVENGDWMIMPSSKEIIFSKTDNIIDADSNSFLLESGTVTDSTTHDYIVVEDSLASRRSITSVGSDQTLSTDPGAFNVEFETVADGIIDFSEGNPFGEAT